MARTVPEFIELLHGLAAKRRDVNIVIRPHPSESLEFYAAAFRGVQNVMIVRDGPVTPWILASEVMLHHGCTTALEAHLLGRPIVNFSPVNDEASSCYLPSLFGAHMHSRQEAMDALLAALEAPSTATKQTEHAMPLPALAKSMFASFEQDGLERYMAVMREAEATMEDEPAPASTISLTRLAAEDARDRGMEEAKHVARRAFFPRRYATAQHGRQRFPGMDRRDLTTKLERLAALTGNALQIAYFSPNVVELSSSRKRTR